MFEQVWSRSMAVSVLGGMAVGFVCLPILAVVEREIGNVLELLGASAVVALIGLLVGFALGMVGGILLGIVMAQVIVPYRGPGGTVAAARFGAAGVVALFLVVLDRLLEGAIPLALMASIGVPSLAGAVLFAPFLVNWYVRRMDDAPATAPLGW